MSVLTPADAAAYLNIKSAERAAELQSMLQVVIDAAEAVIAQRCGPLASTPVTARVWGGGTVLLLPTAPALSLTSVTPVDETALTLSDLYLDAGAGLVTYNSGSTFSARFYTVVYNAGRASVPEDLRMAIRELVRHLWQTQRGPTGRPGSQPSDAAANTIPGAAYLLPFRVSELIGPHLLPPKFA